MVSRLCILGFCLLPSLLFLSTPLSSLLSSRTNADTSTHPAHDEQNTRTNPLPRYSVRLTTEPSSWRLPSSPSGSSGTGCESPLDPLHPLPPLILCFGTDHVDPVISRGFEGLLATTKPYSLNRPTRVSRTSWSRPSELVWSSSDKFWSSPPSGL